MNIAVTGATGFVGQHFIDAATQRGLRVTALIRPEQTPPPHWLDRGVQTVAGSLDDDATISRVLEGADALLFLAAVGVQSRDRNWPEAMDVNVHAPMRWLQHAANMRTPRLVMTGTALEYKGHGTLPEAPWSGTHVPLCAESSPLAQHELYGVSKAAGGLLTRMFADHAGLDMFYLRIASLYGAGDDPDKFLMAALRNLKHGNGFKMSGGAQVREWLHIDDAVEALLLSLEQRPHGVQTVNIGTGQGMTLLQVAQLLCGSLGVDTDQLLPYALPYRHNEVHHLVMDVQAQRQILGFQPSRSITHGVRALVASYDTPEAEPLTDDIADAPAHLPSQRIHGQQKSPKHGTADAYEAHEFAPGVD